MRFLGIERAAACSERQARLGILCNRLDAPIRPAGPGQVGGDSSDIGIQAAKQRGDILDARREQQQCALAAGAQLL